MQFFEAQWHQYLDKTQNRLKGAFYEHEPSHCLVTLNDCEYIGGADALCDWALYNHSHSDAHNQEHWTALAKKAYTEQINASETRKYAQMTISCEGVQG